MATYYIDPDGSDGSGNGSSGNPWKTLYKAVTTVSGSGDIIHVNPGDYTESTQMYLDANVSIEGEGDTSHIISHHADIGYIECLIVLSGSGNTNQSISYIKFDGDNLTGYQGIGVYQRTNVHIHHCTFVNFYLSGALFAGSGSGNNSFHDNVMTNCGGNVPDGDYQGNHPNLVLAGQTGTLVYNNVITQTARSSGSNGEGIAGYQSNVNCKIYGNTITVQKPNNVTWTFSIELWDVTNLEIYNNVISGYIDIAGNTLNNGVSFHDNSVGWDSLHDDANDGLQFENRGIDKNIAIYNNSFKNCERAIWFCHYNSATAYVEDVSIYNNVIYNVGRSDVASGSGMYFQTGPEELPTHYSRLKIWNNTIVNGTGTYPAIAGIYLPTGDDVSTISIRNNIINGFTTASIYANQTLYGTIDTMSIENNLFYQNGNSNAPLYVHPTPTYVTYQNNVIGLDPSFVSSTNFHLLSNSAAISEGIDVNLSTDKDGVAWNSPPSIGAYEYGGGAEPSTAIPIVTTSSISNIFTTSASCGGNVTHDGSANVTAKGVCWNTSINPTISNSHTHDGTGEGAFTSAISGLDVSTHYYVRAYATNSVGTGYGSNVQFDSSQNIIDASVYYVNAISGNDASDGTSENTAWQTIAKVNSFAFDVGDTILFRRGDQWREMILNTLYNNITYGAYGSGDKPIINGADIVTGWSNDSGNVWYANCPVITNYGYQYDYVVVVNNVFYTQVGTKVEVNTANTYFIDKTPLPNVAYIYSTTDPDTKTVEISARMFGIGAQDRTYLRIENLNFKNHAFGGVFLNAGASQIAGYSIISNCDFYYNRQAGLYFDHGYSNNTVEYCNAYYNGNGFYSWGDAGVSYGSDFNIFSHCYAGHNINYPNDGSMLFTDGHGFGIYDSGDNIVEYCESEDNQYGIHTDCANNVRNITYRYNYVHNTQYNTPGIGIGSNASTGSIHQAYYNLVVNTGFGDTFPGEGVGIAIGGNGDRNVYVYNNTIYQDNSHNGIGISCQGGTEPGKNVHIKNNLIYSNNTAAGFISLGSATSGFELNNNMYYAPLDSTNVFYYAGSFYNTLALWQTAISQDASSMYGDPKITTVGSDFRLQADSSCINKGENVGLTQDISGNLITGSPDIGAYEYNEDISTSIPTVTTTAITDISINTATGGGNVTHDGSANVTIKGVVWSTSENPTVTDSSTSNGTGEGSYVSYLTGLNPSTHYHVRAYATNSVGTGYGIDVSFNTLLNTSIPTVTTSSVTNIFTTSASCGGNVTHDGSTAVTARGVCWDTTSSPTVTDSSTSNGTGEGSYVSYLTGLNSSTHYHVRAYATNVVGTAYGIDVSFNTLGTNIPDVSISKKMVMSSGRYIMSGSNFIIF